MLKLTFALLFAAALSPAGELHRQWTRDFIKVEIDTTMETPSFMSPAQHYLVVSLTTMDYRARGFSLLIGLQLEDGSNWNIFRPNLPLPEVLGDPVVLKVLIPGAPSKVQILSVSRLVEQVVPLVCPGGIEPCPPGGL